MDLDQRLKKTYNSATNFNFGHYLASINPRTYLDLYLFFSRPTPIGGREIHIG